MLSIKNLKLLHINKSVTITATVKSMTKVDGDVTAKDRLTGLLMDASGKIDFIVWGEDVNKIHQQLEKNETYTFQSVKVNSCDERFCSTTSGLQLTISSRTTINESTEGPFNSHVEITPLNNVMQYVESGQRINIAGVISEKENRKGKTGKKSDRLVVSIRDETVKLDICFYSPMKERFAGNIGDILLVENVQIKNYGHYSVVNATKAIILINELFPAIEHLQDVDFRAKVKCDLSPKPQEAEKVENITDLQMNSTTQQFIAVPTDLNLHIYDSCPLLSCKKSMRENTESQLYTCNKCKKIYTVAKKGITATIEVSQNNNTRRLLFFNDLAEEFLGISAQTLQADDIENKTNELLEKISAPHRFEVKAGKAGDDFTASAFERIEPALHPIGSPDSFQTKEMQVENIVMPKSRGGYIRKEQTPQKLGFSSNNMSLNDDVPTTPTKKLKAPIKTNRLGANNACKSLMSEFNTEVPAPHQKTATITSPDRPFYNQPASTPLPPVHTETMNPNFDLGFRFEDSTLNNNITSVHRAGGVSYNQQNIRLPAPLWNEQSPHQSTTPGFIHVDDIWSQRPYINMYHYSTPIERPMLQHQPPETNRKRKHTINDILGIESIKQE